MELATCDRIFDEKVPFARQMENMSRLRADDPEKAKEIFLTLVLALFVQLF